MRYCMKNNAAKTQTVESGAKLALFRWVCVCGVRNALLKSMVPCSSVAKIYQNVYMEACLDLHAFELNSYCLVCEGKVAIGNT